ncbi:MAG: alpha/beta hydrolase, partial [Lentilitoribacter sp.]
MYKEQYFQTEDGLKLYLRDYQAKNWSHKTYPVIWLPGLSRNSRDFDKLAQPLSHEYEDNYRVITLDYRGRGNSQ